MGNAPAWPWQSRVGNAPAWPWQRRVAKAPRSALIFASLVAHSNLSCDLNPKEGGQEPTRPMLTIECAGRSAIVTLLTNIG